MRKVFNFLFFLFHKKKLLCQSLFLVSVIRLSLWILPFQWLNKWSTLFCNVNNGNQQTNWIEIKNVVRAVRTCSQYIPHASCLTQALATKTLLGLKRQSSQLKIGVGKDEGGRFTAHAWIEVEGEIIIGKLLPHQHYSVLNKAGFLKI